MTEIGVSLFVVPIKLFSMVIFCWLYSLGGRDKIPLALRRFVAPLSILLCVALFHRTVPVIIACVVSYGLYAITLSLPYGDSVPLPKETKRALWGLFVVFASFPIAYVTHSYILFCIQILFGVTASAVLGSKNPIPAAEEEATIALGLSCLVPFM